MSYVTVALVAEFTTTAVTLAPAELARPEPACALMTVANFCPFSSSEIFFAAEVWPLKNASQFAVICALALPDAAAGELLDAGALGAAEGEEAADAALDGSAVADEL